MLPIRCLIIDDDPFILELLKDKLAQHIPEVKVLATASSGKEGLAMIKKHQPDLLFQDVEMADMTGFQMLDQVEKLNFQTIFITSFSHYAIKAIRFNALDYLMKPIDLGELKAAIKRYKENSHLQPQTDKVLQALENFKAKRKSDQVLTLNTQEGELRIALNQIVRIEADRNYSEIYLSDHRKKIASKTLSDMEDLLIDKGFFRCHKSHIVHAMHVVELPHSLSANMIDGTEVPISRRKKHEFINWYQQQTA